MPRELPQPTSERQISGDVVISEILRNAESSEFRMRRTVVLPSIFHVYLHPSDYDLIRPVLPAMQTEVRSALKERVEELNHRSKPSRVAKFFGFEKNDIQEYRILDRDYTIEFFPDAEGTLERGDIEVRSELATTPRPEFEGAMTRHVTRKQTSPDVDISPDDATVQVSRPPQESAGLILGWLHYSIGGKENSFAITKDEIAIGRGGRTVWVDLQLEAPPDVSREHCRIRYDRATRRFFLIDLSQFGTTVNGGTTAPGPSGAREIELPPNAAITLANVITLRLETAGDK